MMVMINQNAINVSLNVRTIFLWIWFLIQDLGIFMRLVVELHLSLFYSAFFLLSKLLPWDNSYFDENTRKENKK